ncbi:MAG: alpha/beta hydrolase [bacterium]|nr:alpha/beta hydrolase [bacterium]
MRLQVRGEEVRATTGGRPLDPDKSLIVFLHGASQDRTLWALQQRYFSHHGWSVLAPDLPGHGHSGGKLLATIGEMALWVGEVIESAGYTSAAIVGHSMGSLIGLELAATRQALISKLALTGTTSAMRVHETLQASADENERRAHEMILGWSLSGRSGLGGHPTPGLWMQGHLLQTSLNAGDEVLANDLRACDRYEDALDRAAAVECPTLIIKGEEDRMAHPKGTLTLADALGDHATISEISGAGHSMMIERPDAVLDALIEFLA